MKPDELAKEIRKGTIRSAYLLAGEEPLLRDDALACIRTAVLDGVAEDFNLDRLSGDTTSPAALQDSVRALPVMAARRLVILSAPERQLAAAKALMDSLADVVKDLCTQEQTVLVVTAAKVDKRARWVRAFAKSAALVECDPPRKGRALTAFIKQEATRQALELEAGAAELLAERIGPQLMMLRHEIAKAALLAGEGEKVTRRHVELSSSQVAEEPIWDLTDAIGDGRTADAVALLSRLLGSGAAAPVILATLAGHFRKLARLRSGGAVAGPPFIQRKLEGQARRYTSVRLLACLRAIHETDTALKGGSSLPPTLTLERLVIGLAG
jgi:DNA polymerase-3 subunit delta